LAGPAPTISRFARTVRAGLVECSVGLSRRPLRLMNSAWNTGDDLDLEVEPREPVDADRRPIRIRRFREDFAFNGHDRAELILGIGMKGRHVNDIVKPASTRLQGRLEIGECQADLSLKVRLGRAIAATADLTGHEQEVT
jgi:hypothetical protein